MHCSGALIFGIDADLVGGRLFLIFSVCDLPSLNAAKGLKEGLHFDVRTKTLLELCERGFHM